MIDFHKPYSAPEFENFLREFLPEDFEVQNKELLPGTYWKCVKEGRIIGTSKQLWLNVLEFLHENDTDPRVTLTKESFRILAETNNRRSLVVFRNKENKRYRFSLITIDLDIDDDNRITKTYSNAKRYSFLLGEWEPVRTPTKQLEKRVSDFQDLKERFNVEVVRKQFFEDYFDLFVRLYMAILADQNFCWVLSQCWVDRVKFSKNLLGKIVFVYFIQKKGWLGVKKNEEWWTGDRKFLRTLWNRFANNEDFIRPSTGFFYNDYLEHLFYNGFNRDRRDDDDYEPNMRFKVPYLNGGLFKEDYEGWETFTAKISNEIFSNKDNTGILDYFDLYNFTVDEDDPLDAEIAVDPEMLGKIFEKMISVSKDNIDEIVSIYQQKGKAKIGTELNKKFGAFYTPREIVHYMCQESLIQYLLQATRIDERRVRDLVKRKEFSNDWESIDTYNHLAPDQKFEIDRDIALIDEKLQKIKVLDPAVWSGAFPMGLLHEISGIRWYFRHNGFIRDAKSLYEIKKETVLESIYWVDIEPWAIDIARLRFWLSLIVDEEKPEPLPNFEFKFVCANTLLPLSKDEAQLDIFGSNDEVRLDTLKRYKRDYYKSSGKREKAELKEKIRKYTSIGQITLGTIPGKRAHQMHEFWANFDNTNHSHTFFDPSLMFGEWRGFDVVIWNPPYVSALDLKKSVSAEDLLLMKKVYDTAVWAIDLYIYFFEFWLKLLKKWGVLSYITPNKFLSASYWEGLRAYIKNGYALRAIVDYSRMPVFLNASVYPVVTLIQQWDQPEVVRITKTDEGGSVKREISKGQLEFSTWWLLLSENYGFISEVLNQSVSLNQFCTINATSTAWEAEAYHHLIAENIDGGFKLINTGTIDRYVSLWGKRELVDKWVKFLHPYLPKGSEVISENRKGLYWREKIIIAKMWLRCEAFLDDNGAYSSINTNALHSFKIDPLYILGWINSSLFSFLFGSIFDGLRMSGGYLPFSAPNLNLMKIKEPNERFMSEIVWLVNNLLYEIDTGWEKIELIDSEIDNLFYREYWLSPVEIEIVNSQLLPVKTPRS